MLYDTAVFIGRFQPIHNGHKEVIKYALSQAERVLILVGSSHAARNTKNPFNFEERKYLIGKTFNAEENARLVIKPLRDYHYNDQPWIAEVQGLVHNYALGDKICMVAPDKDRSTYYLKLFPQWDKLDIPVQTGISACDVREGWYSEQGNWTKNISSWTYNYMMEFPAKEELREEYKFLKDYRKQWENTPYPPTFVTTDAVTICNGHILLVKRGAQPGKGLWALPGGFLDAEERIEDGTIRELKEETKIKVPYAVLKGSIVKSRVFDSVNRSTRGRTITHASLINLENESELPRIKGSDDAAKACWVSLIDFLQMEGKMYEDHYYIVTAMLGITTH